MVDRRRRKKKKKINISICRYIAPVLLEFGVNFRNSNKN